MVQSGFQKIEVVREDDPVAMEKERFESFITKKVMSTFSYMTDRENDECLQLARKTFEWKERVEFNDVKFYIIGSNPDS